MNTFGSTVFRSLVMAAVGLTATSSTGLAAPSAPARLRCEYRENPLGIDVAVPRLSWQVQDPSRGAVQAAYQIIVSSDPACVADGAVWDSGKVDSDRCVHVEYGGPALESGRRYYWTVRTWDADGNASPFADPAWWEMGLLEPADWSARWITGEKPPSVESPLEWGDWIWHPEARGEKQTVFLRRSFSLERVNTITDARCRMTADDQYVLYVNGRQIGEDGNWKLVREYDILEALKPGTNVIAVRATNGGGACGVLFSMRISFDGGEILEIRSGTDWKVAAGDEPNWTSVDYWRSAAGPIGKSLPATNPTGHPSISMIRRGRTRRWSASRAIRPGPI
jgi:alpha-L-rhamnosidase